MGTLLSALTTMLQLLTCFFSHSGHFSPLSHPYARPGCSSFLQLRAGLLDCLSPQTLLLAKAFHPLQLQPHPACLLDAFISFSTWDVIFWIMLLCANSSFQV